MNGVSQLPLYQPILPARYARPLLDFVGEQCARSVEAILAAAGLSAESLQARDALLTIEQFDALLVASTRLLGRSDVGFEIGRRIDIESHGALVPVLRVCRTVDEVLRVTGRFWRLITPAFAAHYRREGEVGEWHIRMTSAVSHEGLEQMLEMHALSVYRILTGLLGRPVGVEILLSMPPPHHVTRYERLHPVRFLFSAQSLPEVCCRIPVRYLDQPLDRGPQVPHDEVGSQALTRSLRSVAKPSREYAAWAELMLREAEGIQPSLADLAELVNISPRTLTRYFAAEGANFREMGNRIRYQRACTLLAGGRESIEQIAGRLGYNDAANFTHAFRAAGGCTPSAYRRRVAPAH